MPWHKPRFPVVACRGDNPLQTVAIPAAGPGTELKKLLKRVGIVPTPNCKCNARAAEMDWRERETPGWCAANCDLIVGWLREEASSRGLPFVDSIGRMLVRRAIKAASLESA